MIVSSCSPSKKQKAVIAVTQSPYQVFVEKLVQDHFEVVTLIPPGYNPHTFETKPQQMQKLSSSAIWFGVGESFEQKLAANLKKTKYVNLNQEIGIGPQEDLHTWMSPQMVIKQMRVMAQVIGQMYPDLKGQVDKNLGQAVSEMMYLSHEVSETLKPDRGDSIVVSHPSLGYFCKEFFLNQISLETEGKSPRPHDLRFLMQEAQRKRARCVLIQKGFDNRGALIISEKLGIPIYHFDPSDPDYADNLTDIARNIAESKIAECSTIPSDVEISDPI